MIIIWLICLLRLVLVHDGDGEVSDGHAKRLDVVRAVLAQPRPVSIQHNGHQDGVLPKHHNNR